MAKIYPDIAQIPFLRVKPTEGEWELVNILNQRLPDEFEIFFQPLLDGDHPDIIILRKGYGAMIIEVKDWNLDLYRVDELNRWSVKSGSHWQGIKSPMEQVFHYKKNLFELHIPIMGIQNVLKKDFYRVLSPWVYFHNVNAKQIDFLYGYPSQTVNDQINTLNEQLRTSQISYSSYERPYENLKRRKDKLDRDRRMSLSADKLEKALRKWKELSPNNLFSDEIYEDFKRRLSPSDFVMDQIRRRPITILRPNVQLGEHRGREAERVGEERVPVSRISSLVADDRQKEILIDPLKRSKIRGIAGSGKTMLLALKALEALGRDPTCRILILVYNLALKNWIRDQLSQYNYIYSYGVPLKEIEITNYHRLFLDMANKLNIQIDDKKISMPATYRKDIFKEHRCIKYDLILVDEVQDYEQAWLDIIATNFLDKDGSMSLFGDNGQDIYDRRNNDEEEKRNILGFGRWKELSRKSYRYISLRLSRIQYEFEKKFICPDSIRQGNLELGKASEPSHFEYHIYDPLKIEPVLPIIKEIISRYGLSPNDTTLISSWKYYLHELSSQFQERVHTSFCTKADIGAIVDNYTPRFIDEFAPRYSDVMELVKRALCRGTASSVMEWLLRELKYRFGESLVHTWEDKLKDLLELLSADYRQLDRIRKNSFQPNPGMLKFSTIHSFKGMESASIIAFLREKDSPQLVYTAITRAKRNLFVFDVPGSKYESFFMAQNPDNLR